MVFSSLSMLFKKTFFNATVNLQEYTVRVHLQATLTNFIQSHLLVTLKLEYCKSFAIVCLKACNEQSSPGQCKLKAYVDVSPPLTFNYFWKTIGEFVGLFLPKTTDFTSNKKA